MANIHNEIKAIQQKYKSNLEATEVLHEAFNIYAQFTQSLIGTLKATAKKQEATKATKVDALKVYADSLLGIFESILSNPSVSKENIAIARSIFKNTLEDLELAVGTL